MDTWYYFNEYPSDPRFIKLLSIHILLPTSESLSSSGGLYGYGFPSRIVIDPILNPGRSLLHFSNKSWLATGSVMILVVAEFLLTIIYNSKGIPFVTFSQFAPWKGLSMAVNGVSAAGDLLIAVLLCYMLQTSRTGFRKSHTLINKLMVFSINTGLLTSLFALASLVSIAVWPQSFIYITFYFCIGRLYCNSLLATLNARKGLRDEARCGVQRMTNETAFGTSSTRVPKNISIKINTTQEYIQDEQYSSSGGDVKNPEGV
ncbi:hypothetical protein J3R83DRAFT_5196 [Lanmaoa asiatica]|nr:hypothetical protein J3R83DRAFT_5196 [Lanmaoa asiatica]